MTWNRRNFLMAAGLGTAASAIASHQTLAENSSAALGVALEHLKSWEQVRALFNLDPNYVHLAGLLIASNPAIVQAAIESHRSGLDNNPTHYLDEHRRDLEVKVRQSAANYLGVQPGDIALTDSTTMGTGLVINGLAIRPDQEMLTTEFDYYSTHTSLRYKASRSGATVRQIPLYPSIHAVSKDEMVETLVGAIRPNTRLVTATWVHSNTGLKVPIAQISERLKAINANRAEADRVLLFVDGVHGLGVEEPNLSAIDCDFFVAGTHKWMFAPRGSGIIWGNPRSQQAVTPTIPTFSRGPGWGVWMTPGGFKPFEHQWAMVQAFDFHKQIGSQRIKERLYALSQQLKAGLAKMGHVKLYTPIDQALSAAIICFDVDGLSPEQVVSSLRKQNIIASTTPYEISYARVTPGIYNNPAEIERTLRAIRGLA